MAWTTPTLRNAGDAILASDQNIWANNMLALYGSLRRLGYAQRTTTLVSTANATPEEIFSDISWTADGTSAYMVQWWFPYFDTGTAAVPRLILTNGAGVSLQWVSVATTNILHMASGTTWYTPAAGTATVNLAMTTGGSGSWTAGGGAGGATYAPSWLAVWGPALA
jgi:hypothetical protein